MSCSTACSASPGSTSRRLRCAVSRSMSADQLGDASPSRRPTVDVEIAASASTSRRHRRRRSPCSLRHARSPARARSSPARRAARSTGHRSHAGQSLPARGSAIDRRRARARRMLPEERRRLGHARPARVAQHGRRARRARAGRPRTREVRLRARASSVPSTASMSSSGVRCVMARSRGSSSDSPARGRNLP